MATAPHSDQVEIRTLDDAHALISQWEAAYARLQFAHAALQARYAILEAWARHSDPFLPPHLQDAKAREANPQVYELLGRQPQ